MASSSRTLSRTTEDFLFDSFYSGAIGGSVLALFFLIIDLLDGQPLFTPSLIGTVLFSDVPAESVSGVRLDMVAYFTLIHFVAFGLLGVGFAFLFHEVELHSRHPVEVLLLFLLIFEGASMMVALALVPGVTSQLGAFRVFLANLFAATSMGLFLMASHGWDTLKKPRQGTSATEPR
jgi:hypothetical protein